MRFRQINLYSFAAPLAMLPVLSIGLQDVWNYMRGMEFRGFLAEVITQLASGVADAFIRGAFGLAA